MLIFACWRLGKELGNFEKFASITTYIHIGNNFGEKQQRFSKNFIFKGILLNWFGKLFCILAWMIFMEHRRGKNKYLVSPWALMSGYIL